LRAMSRKKAREGIRAEGGGGAICTNARQEEVGAETSQQRTQGQPP
jgi:hypothetical protein